jgi:hypothetical protein
MMQLNHRPKATPRATLRRLLAILIVLFYPLMADGQTFAEVCSESASPVLGVNGWQMTVDGRPRFLVLAAYFSAMLATDAQIERDFAFLKSKGIGGIRVLPFWTFNDPVPRAASTLVDPRGRIRSAERWAHFTTILHEAARCGFVVDVTFNREQLWAIDPPFTVAEYQGDANQTRCATPAGRGTTGIAEITCRLKGPRYTHIFMDLQNERDHGEGPAFPPRGSMRLTDADVRSIRDTVKRVDPTRLVMASHIGGQVDASVGLASPAKAALDVIAFHQGQDRAWYANTRAVIQAIKQRAAASGFAAPIYLQESGAAPDRGARCDEPPGAPNPFIEAVKTAKRAGAAAWTFHTHDGFALATHDFQRGGRPAPGVGPGVNNCRAEREFFDRLKEAIAE